MKRTDDTELKNEFISEWERHYEKAPPLSHVLRLSFPQFWTRFHALPNSKRYSETVVERNIILSRANKLLQECFKPHCNLWLVVWDCRDCSSSRALFIDELKLTNLYSYVEETEEAEDRIVIDLCGVKVLSESEEFDRYFAEVAEDEYRILLFDPATGTVLGPYDGGFDVFSFNGGFIRSLETKYKSWMSELSSKL